jgi:VCBS repeat protein
VATATNDLGIATAFRGATGRAAGLAAAFACSLALLLPQPATAQSWTRLATGDFNGDGTADVLLRDNSGRVAVQLNGGFQTVFRVRATQTRVVGNMSSNWMVAAVGDFNGDGRDDILFHNMVSGAVKRWLMDGPRIMNSTIVGNMPPSASVVNVGDFNGDGIADIRWLNNVIGNKAEWLMIRKGAGAVGSGPREPE